ncbi:hypothetical protein HGRIS_002830 [Hohenbuehelia grisea]|uniref:Uncharacterized protein n=1 Tax=Hohenbuehelia grisea TaxID=104357 RepID=A0ABR3JM80_9AGAR
MALLDFLKKKPDRKQVRRSVSMPLDAASVARCLDPTKPPKIPGSFELQFVCMPPPEEFSIQVTYEEVLASSRVYRHGHTEDNNLSDFPQDVEACSLLDDVLEEFPDTPQDVILPPLFWLTREGSPEWFAGYEQSSFPSRFHPADYSHDEGFDKFKSLSMTLNQSSLQLLYNTAQNAHRSRRSPKSSLDMELTRCRTLSESSPQHLGSPALSPTHRRRMYSDASAVTKPVLTRSLTTPLTTGTLGKPDLRRQALGNAHRSAAPEVKGYPPMAYPRRMLEQHSRTFSAPAAPSHLHSRQKPRRDWGEQYHGRPLPPVPAGYRVAPVRPLRIRKRSEENALVGRVGEPF